MEELGSEKKGPEGPYVEEDFADAIAGVSGKSVKGRNTWCQMMSLTPDRQQYAESSLQAEDNDSHSPGLFRLLNYETMIKGSLPVSCDDYLAKMNYPKRFQPCLDRAHATSAAAPPGSGKVSK